MKGDIKEDSENEQKGSNVDRLLYLKEQKNMIERARTLIGKSKQIAQLQREVITLYHEKWGKLDASVESMQEDIDWYVKEYIAPIQEREKELSRLESSIISIPEKQSVFGRIGKLFERFIPGITKSGREKRKIDDKKQNIKEEIETYKLMIEKNPFKVLGANKDIKSQLLGRMDTTQLDKYSSMQNNQRNYLKPDNSVRSIANGLKREEMEKLLSSYPALSTEARSLINELINNGIESFNIMANQIFRDSNQNESELIGKIDFKGQESTDKDILDAITEQIQSLMDNLTPDELSEMNRREPSRFSDTER